MNEQLTAAAAREHVRDMRATADRYRLVAQERRRRRLGRADSDSVES